MWKVWGIKKMTYSNGLKSVVSDYGTERTTDYYCGSAGHVSQEAVKRYIQEQQGKDVFEYSVFGSPQQKIGDFTQSKLARWD